MRDARTRDQQTLNDLLWRAAETDVGVRFLDARERATRHTYGEILDRALNAAAGMQELGVKSGDRVALIMPTCLAFYAGFFGCLLAGAIPVPMYPPIRLGRLREYEARTAAALSHLEARLILTTGRVEPLVRPVARHATVNAVCHGVDQLPRGRFKPVNVAPDDVALIQMSSGSTAEPKPIPLTHRQLLANTDAILAQLMNTYPEDGDTVHAGVSWLPLYHDMGLVGCVFTALAHPGELTLIPPELFVARPAMWLRALSQYQGTISPAPNFAYSLCLDRVTDEEMSGVDLSCWRAALNGAEPVTPGVLEAFVERFSRFGLRREALTPVYGLAEASLAVTFSPMDRIFTWHRFDREQLAAHSRAVLAEDGVPLVSLGKPLPGFSISIQSDDGVERKAGEVGHIMVRGPSVMKGYWNQAELNSRAFREGWLDTGDLGFWHDGNLYIYGRAKDTLIIRGRKFAPQDIEHALNGMDGVRSGCVAAVGITSEDEEGERLVLLAERSASKSSDERALAAAIRRRVVESTGLVPSEIRVLEPGTLPRTSSGKIRRQEARKRLTNGNLLPPDRIPFGRIIMEKTRSLLKLA